MHEFIEPDPSIVGVVWKTGVVLRYKETRAEIIENYSRSEICIRLAGEQRKTLLEWIRKDITKIHATYPNIEVEEEVPCNCRTCKDGLGSGSYRYSKLVEYLRNGRLEIQCDQYPYETVSVVRLISDITTNINHHHQPDSALGEQHSVGNHATFHIHQGAPNMTSFTQHNHGGNNFQNENKGGTVYQGTNHINNNPEPKTAAEAAKEIQELLVQLSKDNPLADEEDRANYLRKALSKTRLQRSTELILTATEAAIEEIPFGKVVTSVIKKAREQELENR